MASGTIKWFDTEKGYGFIQQDDGGKDLFVHVSETDGNGFTDGERVEFEVGEGPRGANAKGVKRGG